MAITRLGQIGVGVDAYAGFLPKTAAEPQPEEEFRGFPNIVPQIVEGDGYGVLPRLQGSGRGVHGVVGEAFGRLPGLVGDAVGEVGTAGAAVARLSSLRGEAACTCGAAGEARGTLRGFSASAVGSTGVQGHSRASLQIKGAAIGQYDPDDEDAIIAFLLAA